ncbi:GNAT family N-acetyltransferase [Pseudoduganella lutea]|uniref:N-acetyltransferase family protein n=1 Tax=Pseudoduganella lutea TaxID=321985 RepID=A0A4P6L6G9_9BURK|nr:GNAT family N-acetyltransferase [Pseudoduganella lutea]QBE66472.1 N-acetyltransferase family protein [Pseudoduganella lutea]
MSFRHRIATLDDLPTIVAIYNSTIASREVTADTEPVSVESRLNWFHDHQPERRPLWVIERADDTSDQPEILGWISYSNFYGRPAYSGTAEVSIYIHEAWRGKGIGRYALTEAIAFAPQVNVHTVLGFIFGHNGASLALFRKFGFEEWAHFPRVANLDGVERDLIILGKRVA